MTQPDDKDEQVKLLPCPFCGSNSHPRLLTDKELSRAHGPDMGGWWVVCDAAGGAAGCGYSAGWRATEQEAAQDWNHRATAVPESQPRAGLPLLYNIVCLWAQEHDNKWFEDMAELCRLADKLLSEHGYEVGPYTTNAHQVAADSARSTSGDIFKAALRDITAPLIAYQLSSLPAAALDTVAAMIEASKKHSATLTLLHAKEITALSAIQERKDG